MYTVVRRYDGVVDTEEMVRRATTEFGPKLAERDGFRGYWLVDTGSGVLASITVFETKAQADASTEAAAEWVRDRVLELSPNPPHVTAGATTGLEP
jgi:hypothetical protein